MRGDNITRPLCAGTNRDGFPCGRYPRYDHDYCANHDRQGHCQARNAGGDPCGSPKMIQDLVPGVPLCFVHAATLVIETHRAPTLASVRRAEREGHLRLVR